MIRFDKHILYQISLIQIALAVPGRHLLLLGQDGSGRYSLTRFVAHMLEYDFVNLAEPSPDDVLAPDDRFTTLASLLRDVVVNVCIHRNKTIVFVRQTRRNAQEVEILANFAAQRGFAAYFSQSLLDDLYTRCYGTHQLTADQRMAATRQITNVLRMNVKVVIARPEAMSSNCFSERFDRIYLCNDSLEIFQTVATNALDGSMTRQSLSGNGEQIALLLVEAAALARLRMPFFHPNSYSDFVACVAHFAATEYREAFNRDANSQASLEFLSALQVESHQVKARLDSLAPKLQRLRIDSDALHASHTARKEAADTRRVKFDEGHRAKLKEVNRLDEDVTSTRAERNALIPRIDQ